VRVVSRKIDLKAGNVSTYVAKSPLTLTPTTKCQRVLSAGWDEKM
jgi:hypothetical protein